VKEKPYYARYRRYYEKNKERIKERGRVYHLKYYQEHKEILDAKARAYAEEIKKDPEKLRLKKEYRKEYRTKHKERQDKLLKLRRKQREDVRDEIALHYKCRNPGCLWKGPFAPSQLDFHHHNQKEKAGELGQMKTASVEKYMAEVNKCIILCRNCHSYYHTGAFQLDELLRCKVKLESIIEKKKNNSPMKKPEDLPKLYISFFD